MFTILGVILVICAILWIFNCIGQIRAGSYEIPHFVVDKKFDGENYATGTWSDPNMN